MFITLDMFSYEPVKKLILIFIFTECASKLPVNLIWLSDMVSSSNSYSTAEVLAVVLESHDEDLS